MGQQNAANNGTAEEECLSKGSIANGTTDEFVWKHDIAKPIFIGIISAIEIPFMVLTLFALCSLIKSHRSAPVFVIQLILSDLIQIICMLIIITYRFTTELFNAHLYSLILGLYFMACIAFERYLLVSHPHWYKSHNSLKVSCVISVIIWFVPLIFAYVNSSQLCFDLLRRSIACIIPYPIILLCFVGTCRGLSHAISLTALKRKSILGSLFLVLLTYTFIILPYVILCFIRDTFTIDKSSLLVKITFFLKYLQFLNPLADCILYLFIRPDVGDLLKSVHCCCKSDRHQNSRLKIKSVSRSITTCSSV